jgi:hypothetical protein
VAAWDAVAKIAEKPLYRFLADRYRAGVADSRVWVYAAGGANLAVDANGRLRSSDRGCYAKALRPHDLFWYEEAGAPWTTLLCNCCIMNYVRLASRFSERQGKGKTRWLLQFCRFREQTCMKRSCYGFET